MTMRPKGRKFRIRKGFGPETDTQGNTPRDGSDEDNVPEDYEPRATGPAQADQPATEPAETPEEKSADASARPEPKPDATPNPAAPDKSGAASDGPSSADREIEAIKAEGLTGRQLRMARRTAIKHGITSSSDHDAVRQLRARGIDPFARSNMLELIVSDSAKGEAEPGVPANRPGTEPAIPKPALPAGPMDEASRAAEIMRVQRDIARRRKRRLALLGVRLFFFVLLPTLIAGVYFHMIATPLYATHTAFEIDKADSPAASPGGGLFTGTGLANATDSITVQEYLESREAMLRLDEELNFREVFSDPDIDPLTRLDPDASNEAMYDVYRRNLTIGYDPTEGIIRMEVRAPDPVVSQHFSEALIRYAEARVDQMSQRVREDQMSGARESYEEAEQRMIQAQQRVIDLQEQRGVLSTEAEVSTVFNQISTFELQLQEERIRLQELLSVDRPNETRVEVSRQSIDRLERTIADLRSGLTTAEGEGDVSLARVSSELIVAQADLETRQTILAQALQQMETARIEANRQSLYLSIGVFPVPPDEAAYPKAWENTLLTFFVFAGIYLMLSMTVAILREQVSA
ncbi:capsule biosynthesis protein [Rhodobacterales bacterium HKCCE3408]|nr:capsule biosynthesis protein [Rhodobacterales bacterium HKCCE3408]